MLFKTSEMLNAQTAGLKQNTNFKNCCFMQLTNFE